VSMLTNRNVARAFSTRPGTPPPRIAILGVIAVTIVLSSVARVEPQSPRYGGVLVSAPLSAPPSLSPHEESTIATLAIAAPCFNNLVTFDPIKQREAPDSVIGEL